MLKACRSRAVEACGDFLFLLCVSTKIVGKLLTGNSPDGILADRRAVEVRNDVLDPFSDIDDHHRRTLRRHRCAVL